MVKHTAIAIVTVILINNMNAQYHKAVDQTEEIYSAVVKISMIQKICLPTLDLLFVKITCNSNDSLGKMSTGKAYHEKHRFFGKNSWAEKRLAVKHAGS